MPITNMSMKTKSEILNESWARFAAKQRERRAKSRPNFRTIKNQTFFDGWEGREVTVRFAGLCICCGSKTYQPSDEKGHFYDPDPRGVFGPKHASASFVASEYGMTGPDVPCCFDCANTRETYEKGLVIAKKQWKNA